MDFNRASFTKSQAWLHSWVGLLIGWLLFVIFFAGTATVFRGQADYWLQPELHHPSNRNDLELLRLAEKALHEKSPRDAEKWAINFPTGRDERFSITWRLPASSGLSWYTRDQKRYLNSDNGDLLPEPRKTRAMTMLYVLHYSLYQARVGIWIVGGLSVAMLVLLLGGVIIHKKIFKDFFTFRPNKSPGRSWLDFHNFSSVMVLPFTLMITYTGLIIWWYIWMPFGITAANESQSKYESLGKPEFVEIVPPASGLAITDSLIDMVGRARELQPQADRLQSIVIQNPWQENSTVYIYQEESGRYWGALYGYEFDGITGEPRRKIRMGQDDSSALVAFQIISRIIHEISFATPLLRWLYFLMSALSCAMIATGLILWSVKRRAKFIKEKSSGKAIMLGTLWWLSVEAINLGVIMGIIISTATMFWANRLIPSNYSGRDTLEIDVFFCTWLICALFSAWRVFRVKLSSKAKWDMRKIWGEQVCIAAFLYLLLPVLNMISTPNSSLWVTLNTGQWVVAAFDMTMFILGGMLFWGARFLAKGR
ncbi:PepSY-associated TM helix domain-containing protein [Pseudomonas aeruginosa]|uniref:PepSY-associated TM helix domain-containing protein n=1 Tax=Pseudomonas aeruginosa TaxID=287 RepID=UPI0034D26E16